MQRRYPGFTLVELLVVVAIIAVLISMLIPALGAARDKAKLTICQANLKGVGEAALTYAQSYSDHIPQLNEAGEPGNPSGAICWYVNKFTPATEYTNANWNSTGLLWKLGYVGAKELYCPTDPNISGNISGVTAWCDTSMVTQWSTIPSPDTGACVFVSYQDRQDPFDVSTGIFANSLVPSLNIPGSEMNSLNVTNMSTGVAGGGFLPCPDPMYLYCKCLPIGSPSLQPPAFFHGTRGYPALARSGAVFVMPYDTRFANYFGGTWWDPSRTGWYGAMDSYWNEGVNAGPWSGGTW